MKTLIEFIKETEYNIKVNQENEEYNSSLDLYYVNERLRLILADLIIEYGIKEIPKEQDKICY